MKKSSAAVLVSILVSGCAVSLTQTPEEAQDAYGSVMGVRCLTTPYAVRQDERVHFDKKYAPNKARFYCAGDPDYPVEDQDAEGAPRTSAD